MARIYHLKKTQFLPLTLNEAWEFISSPKNLKVITPDYMGFDIINEVEDTMYEGQIIEYSVKPLMNIPMKWVTEITHLKAPHYFVDEQRFGPYKFWHHKHFLSSAENGVEMTDLIHYSLPFGMLGKVANTLLVKHQLEEIFNYRYHKLQSLFAAKDTTYR